MADLQVTEAPFDGRWWSPEDESNVVAGRLDLVDDVWRLTLFGWIGQWEGRGEMATTPNLLHGMIGSHPATLVDLVPGGWSGTWNGPPHETRLAANGVIVGGHVTGSTVYDVARVRVLNLDEWANRQPWVFDSARDPVMTESVTFADPGTLTAEIPFATVQLWRGWGRSGGGLSDVTMTSEEWVQFDLSVPKDLAAIEQECVRPLTSLIELAAAERSMILDLRLTEAGGDEISPELQVLSSAPRGPVPDAKQWFQFIFTLQSIEFAQIVPRWWELHEQIGIVADLLAGLRSSGYVGNHFLNAASAIEGYHRRVASQARVSKEHKIRLARIKQSLEDDDRDWVMMQLAFSHQPTFADRIDEIVARGGPIFAEAVGNAAAWRTWVKNGRNSIAHREPGMLDLDREWRVAVRVTTTMEWLLILVMLRDLGIEDEVIEEGVRREGGLRAASDFLRGVRPDWFE